MLLLMLTRGAISEVVPAAGERSRPVPPGEMRSAHRRLSPISSWFAARFETRATDCVGWESRHDRFVNLRNPKIIKPLAHHGRYFSKIVVRVTHAGAKRKGGHDADLISARVR